MGIKGLFKLITERVGYKLCDIDYFRGQTVAIDGCLQVYKFITVVKNTQPYLLTMDVVNVHLIGIFRRTIRLLESGIKPIYVFDGVDKPSLKNASRTNYQYFDECMKMLKMMGIPVMQAPGEGEAQCARMERITLSEDMDSLAFGAEVLLRNLQFTNKKGGGKVVCIELCTVLNALEMDRVQFIDLCILLGCDYTCTIPGIGAKKAYRLMREHKSIEKILMNTNYIAPEAWNYEAARQLFQEPNVCKEMNIDTVKMDEQQLHSYLVGDMGLNGMEIRSGIQKLKNLQTLRQPSPSFGALSLPYQ